MPTINAPTDSPDSDESTRENESWEEWRRVQLFLNVPSWKCVCGLVFQGRVLQCIRCHQSRPENYRRV